MRLNATLIRITLFAAACVSAIAAPAAARAASEFGNFLAGRHAQALHNTEYASEFMARVLEENPDDQRLLRRVFTLTLRAGKMEKAVILARRIENTVNRMSTAALLLGVEAMRQGNFAEAFKRFDSMSRSGVSAYSAPLSKAWALFGLEKTDAAIKALAPLDQKSGFAMMRDLHTGLINDVANRTQAALAAYRSVTKTMAETPMRVVRAAGSLLERSGQTTEARALYQKFLAKDPKNFIVTREIERLDAGIAAKALIATPGEGVAEGLFNVASALPRQRSDGITMIYARLAVYMRPDFELAQLLLGALFDRQERYAKANALYRTVDPASPYSWAARLRVASNLVDLDDLDGAIDILNAMAEERPERTDALILLGGFQRAKERYSEAVRTYDRAAERLGTITAQDWLFFYNRGIALERSDQWPRAEKDFLKALDLQPEQPYVLNYLGYSWVEKNININRARKMIERAVAQRQNDGYIVDSLGWVLYQLGDYAGSVKQLERAIRLRSRDPVISDHLGDAYWRVGRKLEARFQWQRALDFEPEDDQITKIQNKLDSGLNAIAPKGSGG
jgi:tetratricopeptide (TPR) repeat protein